MTAVVGIVENELVWLGGDSAGVGGLSMQTRSDPKVFENGESVIGYTTSFRMGQILEHHLSLPVPYENENGMRYMVKRFVPSVKAVLKGHGFQECENGRESGGTFLVGYRGDLFEINDDYQVARVRQRYHAVGCGRDLALGSLFTTNGFDIPTKERIKLALASAAEFSAGVRPPFTIIHTKAPR
jgi:hypothetical protein